MLLLSSIVKGLASPRLQLEPVTRVSEGWLTDYTHLPSEADVTPQ